MANHKQMARASPTNGFWQPIVICRTCGKRKAVAPSMFERKQYCDRVCFNNRPTTIAGDILRRLGGAANVARMLGLPQRGVRAWVQNGVPARRRREILALSGAAKAGVTMEKLLASYREGQSRRVVARARRKESNTDRKSQEN